MEKKVIITADDFCMSPLFNQAILELLEEGAVTSTSLMISRISSSQKTDIETLKALRNEKDISIGLHIEFSDTRFDYHIERQLNGFLDVFGTKPDYIDIHATTYLKDGYTYIEQKALKLGIPCRNLSSLGFIHSESSKTTGDLIFGTKKTTKEITEAIQSSSKKSIEVVFHPGHKDERYVTGLKQQRQDDIGKCRELKKFLQEKGIGLASYRIF